MLISSGTPQKCIAVVLRQMGDLQVEMFTVRPLILTEQSALLGPYGAIFSENGVLENVIRFTKLRLYIFYLRWWKCSASYVVGSIIKLLVWLRRDQRKQLRRHGWERVYGGEEL